MLARLASGIALASMTALVLVGCAPPEPTEEELRAQVMATFDGFYQTVDQQFAAGTASSSALSQYATEELAETWARDIQQVLDSGSLSRGVLVVLEAEVTSVSPDRVTSLLCTDGREIVTTNADGSTQAPSELVAWEARFQRTSSTELLLDGLEPIADQSVCGEQR